jgi:hypothetical protein
MTFVIFFCRRPVELKELIDQQNKENEQVELIAPEDESTATLTHSAPPIELYSSLPTEKVSS